MDRTCIQCGEPVPEGRSVCPGCGRLQPGTAPATPQPPTDRPAGPTIAPATIGPIPMHDPQPVAARTAAPRRSSSRTAVVVLVVLACLGAIAAGVWYLDDRSSSDDAGAAKGGTTTTSTDDPRPALVRGYCDDPRPLTGPGKIPTFTPGAGAVAYVQMPQPASSTDEAGERVVQVSPTVGKPNLDLAASMNLVSLAVCLDQTSSKAVTGTCEYELTNPKDLGEPAEADLLETTYRIRLIELRTGKALAKGTLSTGTDSCPEFAVIGGKGVSNALTEQAILGWIGQHLVNGQPS